MKMYNIGMERERPETAVAAPEKGGKTYPTITLRENQAPFIKDWEVGREYDMMIRVRKTGEHEPQPWDYGSDKSMVCEFEIREAGVHEEET